MNKSFWKGKKILITGHTGFKGSWLSLWLSRLGACVYGYSLAPTNEPNLYSLAKIPNSIKSSFISDIRDHKQLENVVSSIKPEIIFHLAAQPLVINSYQDPIETISTNVMGTANLFEAARATDSVKVIINITTDKCYENREWEWPYRETDTMGGNDPYSSSKACSELLTTAYRKSFFNKLGVQVASARAGNVIGGGDWSENRLVPDIFKSIQKSETIQIRNPKSTRPWQHVLEPLSGYLKLAEKLHSRDNFFCSGWNFGPENKDSKSVEWIVRYICTRFQDARWQVAEAPQSSEANMLALDNSKSRYHLDWRPTWSVERALDRTIEWHNALQSKRDMTQVCLEQIAEYEKACTHEEF